MRSKMDIILGFVSSTALIFNLGAYLLPSNFSRPFTNIIGLVPQYADAPSLDITFNGRCYADSIRISCVDTMLEIAQNQVTGYEAPEALLWTSEWFLKMLKPLNASYMIFHGLLLVSCYALLTYELVRTGNNCPTCERDIMCSYKKFAVICMELTTVAGLAATGVGLIFAVQLTSDQILEHTISRIGSGWIMHLLATLLFFGATIWFSMPTRSEYEKPASVSFESFGDGEHERTIRAGGRLRW